MAREVVSVHVGGCGLVLGSALWKNLLQEHGLPADGSFPRGQVGDQLEKVGAFFHEASDGHLVPRAVVVDARPDGDWKTKFSRRNRPLQPESIVAGLEDVFNNWGKGFHRAGKTVAYVTMETIRKTAERCEDLQGFQMSHSICGGTGGGVGSLLLQQLADEYPKKVVSSISVMTSPPTPVVASEVYAMLLSYAKLVQHADLSFLLDDAHLRSVCVTSTKTPHPGLADVNRALSSAMSGITCPLRYPDQSSGDLREMAKSLVPVPSLPFLNTALSPAGHVDRELRPLVGVNDAAMAIFDPTAQMTRCHPRAGKFLSLSCQFRGPFPPREAEEHVRQLTRENRAFMADVVLSSVQTSLCPFPRSKLKKSAAFLSSHTSMKTVLQQEVRDFQASFDKRHGLAAIQSAGVEDEDFLQAKSALEDVVDEYQRWEDL